MAIKSPSQRQLRVGEEIRHILAQSLIRSRSGDPLLDTISITVTEVRVSPDLQNAAVYVMPLKGKNLPEILKAFKERRGFFRTEIAKSLKTRIVPRLMFHGDATFEEAERLNTLLNSPKVKRDIEDV